MEQRVLGIDVSKETLDVAVEEHGSIRCGQFANHAKGHMQLDAWLQKQGTSPAHVCLEATGQYGDKIAKYLYEQGYRVSVVNPAKIKHYGSSKLRRNKTDKADAQLIAEYCRRENPEMWSPPPASFKDLQALVRHLEDLQVMRQQEVNRLASGVQNAIVIESLRSLLAYLDEQIKQTKKAIQCHIDQHEGMKRMQELLVTIPGIGELTAAKLLGEIRSALDFDSARQLAAYAGLTPRNFFSGTSVHKKTRLSKTGNANLRRVLFLPAIVAKRYNPIIRSFCERLSKSGLKPMEVIGAAMRKLLHIVFGVLKSGRPFDPNYLTRSQALS